MKRSVIFTGWIIALLLVGCMQDIPPTATPQPIADQPATPTTPPTPIPPTYTPAATAEPTIEPAATAVTFATAESPPLTQTEYQDLLPWQNGQLRDELAVTNERQGACWVGSLVTNRPDAWRCATPNETYTLILDPCFVNPANPNGELACLNSDLTVTLLTLAEPLPEEFANSSGPDKLPLKVVLADGDECGLLLGATITIPLNDTDQRVNYACTSGGILIGEPNKENEIWTITYNADPRGDAEMEQKQIVQAFAFNGRTATIGGAPIQSGSAQITAIASEALPGLHRFTFQFDSPEQPAFEIGYVNEPYEQIPEGRKVMRVWFSYPQESDADYTAERTVTGDYPEHINEVFLVLDDGRDLVWALGLDQMVGFTVNRSEDQLVFDVYDPVPNASEREELGVGSSGTAVRAIQQQLVGLGFLAEMPIQPNYDEPTRKAVVAFQQAHGITPNGVVGADTWATLERELPPTLEPQGKLQEWIAKLLAQETAPTVTPNSSSGANLRSGPGMEYPTIAVLPAGVSTEVIAIQPGSDPTTTWLQICCVDNVSGWVRADVVRIEGSTDAVGDPTVPPEPGVTLEISPANRPSQTADGSPILYFTFDDGPSQFTAQVATALEQHGGFATFFALGPNVNAFASEVGQLHGQGHAFQNHTWNHASLDSVTPTVFYDEVESTQQAIYAATGEWPICLRPPYGATNEQTFQLSAEMGLEIALWDIDTQDWRLPGVDAITNHILTSAFPGAIILMHDGGGDRTQSVAALQQALPILQEQGYKFGVLCRAAQ